MDSIEDVEIPPLETCIFESAALKEYEKRKKQGFRIYQRTNHLDISPSMATNQSSSMKEQVKFSFNISYSYVE